MPRCALVTSPGRGGEPPPIRALGEAVWCGARKGRATGVGTGPLAQAPAILITSRASPCSSGGISDGSRRAASVLPAPGGPVSSRLWPPAAAISRARRSLGWPLRSARSGASGSAAAVSAERSGCGTGSRSPSGERGQARDVIERHHLQPLDQRRLRRRRPAPRRSRAGPASARPRPSPARPARAGSSRRGRAPRRARSAPARLVRSGRWRPAARRRSPGRSPARPCAASAGARFAVIRFSGNSKPEFSRAERTRSRDSRTEASGSPTIANAGQARCHVQLDVHGLGLDRDQGEGAGHREHAATLGGRRARLVRRSRRIRAASDPIRATRVPSGCAAWRHDRRPTAPRPRRGGPRRPPPGRRGMARGRAQRPHPHRRARPDRPRRHDAGLRRGQGRARRLGARSGRPRSLGRPAQAGPHPAPGAGVASRGPRPGARRRRATASTSSGSASERDGRRGCRSHCDAF